MASQNANGVKGWDSNKKRLVANGTGGFDLVDRAPRDAAMNAKKDARLKDIDKNPSLLRRATNALGLTGPGDLEHRSLERRAKDDDYYGPIKKPTPARTPVGPGPKKGPSKAPTVTAKKSVVATPQRAAARTTIANVNSSDRATGNAYSSGYGSSRQAGGWGAGNKPKKGVGVSTGGSAGKSIRGLKWFNGKD